MKKIFSFTNLLLVFGCLILLSFIVIPCFFLDKETSSVQPDSFRLRVVNNDLVLDDSILMCHFVPVVGGMILSGNTDSINVSYDTIHNTVHQYHMRNEYVHSFIIGEMPVSRRLWAFVNRGFEPERDNVHNWKYIYEDSLTSDQWHEFIEKLNRMTGRKFRLPSNEEWEYAARGGQKSRHFKYAGSDDIDKVAFYKGNWNKNYMALGGGVKMPNELGLYDMSGSVWEITSSLLLNVSPDLKMYEDKLNDLVRNSVVYRGGSYTSSAEECALDYLEVGWFQCSGARLVLEY